MLPVKKGVKCNLTRDLGPLSVVLWFSFVTLQMITRYHKKGVVLGDAMFVCRQL